MSVAAPVGVCVCVCGGADEDGVWPTPVFCCVFRGGRYGVRREGGILSESASARVYGRALPEDGINAGGRGCWRLTTGGVKNREESIGLSLIIS